MISESPKCCNPKKCRIEGCGNLARNKGKYKGMTLYGNTCTRHHKTTNRNHHSSIDNSKCEQCGWDKAFCDRHRLDPKSGYHPSNVKVLCPNCHRMETIKDSKNVSGPQNKK